MINQLSSRLRLLRQEKSLTQGELAAEIQVPRVTYTHYELGKRTPDLDTIIRLARHFQVTVDFLVGNSELRSWASARSTDYTLDASRLQVLVADGDEQDAAYADRQTDSK